MKSLIRDPLIVAGLILGILVLGGVLCHSLSEGSGRGDDAKPGSGKTLYVTQELRDTCEFEDCDIRLLEIQPDGSSSILVENLTELFRMHYEWDDRPIAIDEFYFPPEGDRLYFVTAIGSSSCCRVHGFDVSEGRFFDLEHGSLSSMRGDLASPDGSMILRMSSDGTELSVSDVVTDTIIDRVRAAPGETFTESIGTYGGDPIGRYAWKYDGFEYTVFSSSEALVEENQARTPIRTEFHMVKRAR